ncbi:MAG: hypothetical protein ACOYNS_17340 [Bacteroidota bacterium]
MKLSIYFLLVFAVTLNGQSILERYSAYGTMFVPKFQSAPFPHPDREKGRLYNNQTYSAQEHYSDSSVAIFIPKGYEPKKSVDLVIYFHGWHNNIDSACAQFALIEQFCEAKKNAVFVFPEGPKDSPDSFGGRVEETDGLKNLVADVMRFLKTSKRISTGTVGNIVLAGHSGAFRVIAFAVMRGGLTPNISDVILFDALYGETEKFTHWIENSKGRLVNIYTDDGGTKNETEDLMADLSGWGIPFCAKEEKDVIIEDLKKNRLIFIHTELTHNEVIASKRQFRDYLLTSRLQSLK